MKTLLFTLEYPPWHGGVANYYGNLIKFWPACAKAPAGKPAIASQHEAGKPEPDGIEVLDNNDGHLISNKLPLLKWLPAYFALRQKIKQKKIEHVLVGHILPLGTVALIFSRFSKVKYSVILHGLDFTCAVKSYRKKFISKMILAGAEKIICANNYVASLARQTVPEIAPKIVVVNPGVENHITRPPSASSIGGLAAQFKTKHNLHNKIILLSVGRLIKRKGFDMVIKSMPKVLERAPNLIYIIIGDGEELKNYELRITPLRQACGGQANYGLKDKVIIINQATDEERDSWYNACDIFIMPARNMAGDFEGFGLVYLEANLAGKPVIAGQSGGVGDAVVDGLNGLLVDPENINDLSEKIIKLALNPGLRRKLGEQGRARALSDFNWEKQVQKIYNIIKPL